MTQTDVFSVLPCTTLEKVEWDEKVSQNGTQFKKLFVSFPKKSKI